MGFNTAIVDTSKMKHSDNAYCISLDSANVLSEIPPHQTRVCACGRAFAHVTVIHKPKVILLAAAVGRRAKERRPNEGWKERHKGQLCSVTFASYV